MKLLMSILALATIGCATSETTQICQKIITEDDARPDILVIGDSISLGYTPHLSEKLPIFDVVHNHCNARDSMHGVANIDEWLDQRPDWYAITFNHGLHNAARWDTVPDMIATYKANLTEIAQKIKLRTARPVFILTTEIPAGTPNFPDHVVELNQAAVDVMTAEGIGVVDLYTFSLTIQHLHQDPKNVHYVDDGSKQLADYIAVDLFNLYGIQ